MLDFAIELYRRNLPCFAGIYAVASVPFLLLSTPLTIGQLAAGPEAVDFAKLGLSLGLVVIHGIVVAPIISGAMTLAVSERYLGRPAGVLSAYRRTLRRALPLWGAMALVTVPLDGLVLAMVVGLIAGVSVLALALFPGVEVRWVTIAATSLTLPAIAALLTAHQAWFGFVPAAVVLEERGLGSVFRSLELVRGRFGRVFRLVAVLMLMVLVAAAFVRLPTQVLAGTAGLSGSTTPILLGTLAMQLAVLLTDPVRMVGMTLIYYDLRVRGEAFDLALLAEEMGPARPSERAE